MSTGWIPPQNIEAEQAVLGCILTDDTEIANVSAILRPEMFYREAHGMIYSAMLDLQKRAEPIDLITLETKLEDTKVHVAGSVSTTVFEAVGGFAYIRNLMDALSSSALAAHYATLVEEKYILRQAYGAAAHVARTIKEGVSDATEVLSIAQECFGAIALRGTSERISSLADLIDAEMANLNIRREEGSDALYGLKTPFNDLDFCTQGFAPGDLVILAARPSMGKTACAIQFLMTAAEVTNLPALFFSLEMPGNQIVQRILCSEARISSGRFRSGVLTESEWEAVGYAANKKRTLPVYIDDTTTIDVPQMRAKATKLQRDKGLSLIVVDYVQIIAARAGAGNRARELGQIAADLKAMGRDLGVPVIILAQLNRAVDTRPNKRPMLSDLRESGDLEAAADVVLFLYREDYYKQGQIEEGAERAAVERAEIIIAKQRNGPTGTVSVAFAPAWARFEEWDDSHTEVPEPDEDGVIWGNQAVTGWEAETPTQPTTKAPAKAKAAASMAEAASPLAVFWAAEDVYEGEYGDGYGYSLDAESEEEDDD